MKNRMDLIFQGGIITPKPEVRSDSQRILKDHNALAVVVIIFHDGYTEHAVSAKSRDHAREAVNRLDAEVRKLKKEVDP